MKILGICGSLRKSSSNALLLNEIQKELQEHQWFHFDLKELPYFDPDLQFSDEIPGAVRELRKISSEADKIVITTPEYAHGIPGILKNALEWMFHEGTQKKKVYLLIGSAQGENTKAQLIEVLKTMDFEIDESNVLLIKGARSLLSSKESFSEGSIKKSFTEFCQKIPSTPI